jgi:hypothetical protein
MDDIAIFSVWSPLLVRNGASIGAIPEEWLGGQDYDLPQLSVDFMEGGAVGTAFDIA